MKNLLIGVFSVLAVWTVIAMALIPRPAPDDRIPLIWVSDANPQRDPQINRFNELYPHLFLRLDADNSGVMKVMVQSSAGMGPDLIDHINPVTAQTYLEAGILWDITEQAEAMGFGPDTLPEAVRPLVMLRDWETMEYRQYFYPCNVSHTYIFYNKDHFDEAGLPYPSEDMTWDEYIELAQALTRYPSDGGSVPDVFGGAGVSALLGIWGQGGDLLNAEGTRSRMADPESIAGMKFYHDLFFKHNVEPTPTEQAGVLSAGGEFGAGSPRFWFGEGKLSMLFRPRWLLISLRRQFEEQREAQARWDEANPGLPYPGLRPFRLGATLVPRFPGQPRYTIMTARGTGINAMSSNREQALLFLQYLASEAYSDLINEGADSKPGNHAYISLDRFRHPDYPDEEEVHRMEIESTPYGRIVPMSPFIQAATVMRILSSVTSVVRSDPRLTPEDIAGLMRRADEQINRHIARSIEREPRMRRIYEHLLAEGAEPRAEGKAEGDS